jgi:hypothetical protein
MGKSWPFRKTKHDGEGGSSHRGKKLRQRRYVPVEFVRQLWEANQIEFGTWKFDPRRRA